MVMQGARFFIFLLVGAFAAFPSTEGFSREAPGLPGLALHLDAGDESAVVLAEDGSVLQWNDSAGSPVAFVPPGRRPRFVADAANGRPAIRFEGSAYLVASSAAAGITNGISGITLFAVGWNTGGGSQTYVRIGAGDSVAALRFMLARRSGDHRLLARRVDGGEFQELAGGQRLREEWGIDSAVVDFANAEAALFINGEEVARTVDFGDPGNTSATDSLMFRIGNDHSGQFWQGDIAEILIFERVLSPAERDQVEAYLDERYGISSHAAVNADGRKHE